MIFNIRRLILSFLILITLLLYYFISCLYSAAFDRISIGARPIGMGGAFTAVSDDGNAVYWNPAGLGKIKTRQLNAMHQDLFGLGLINYDFIGYIKPKMGKGTLGFSWIRFGTSNDVEFMDYSENTYIFSYGVPLPANMFAGVNIKYYYVNYDEKATGFGADIGILREYMDGMVTIGAVCQDVNRPEIRWTTGVKDKLPINLRVGVAYMPVEPLTIAVDIDKLNHTEQYDSPELHVGSELWFYRKIIAIRMGYINQEPGEWNFSTGVGFQYNKIRFDYAYRKHFDMTDTHIFSLHINFDKMLTLAGVSRKPMYRDTIGPELSFVPGAASFSPDGDGINDTVSFSITAIDESGIGSWKIEITDSSGRKVYTISAEGIPPPMFEWEGKDPSSEEPLPEGKYMVVFSATDKKGNHAELEPLPVTIELE